MLLALASTTVWFAILWVVDYAVDYWVGIAVIAYLALWMSKAAIGKLTLLLFQRLRRSVLQVAVQLGIDLPPPAEHVPGTKVLAYLILLSVVATILGAAVTIITLAASVVGFPPLGVPFLAVGLTLLTVGLLVLVPFFARSFMFLADAKALSDRMKTRSNLMRKRVIQIEQSESEVSRLLRTQPQAA